MMQRPVPTGEYAVGTLTFTIYHDREETLPGSPETKRNVAARIYYPVQKESVHGLHKARYMSKEMAKGLARSVHAPIPYEKREKAGDNISDCYPDAPYAEGKRFPLIVYNHGYFSYRESNSFLCIELASQGYVVLSVAHSLEAACTEFDDGTYLYTAKGIAKKQYEPYFRGMMAAYRLIKSKGSEQELAKRFDEMQKQYCRFIISRIPEWEKDTLSAIHYARGHFADRIDFDMGIGITGHSIGGAVAYALCLDVPEFTCGINIDGALFGDHNGKILDRPFIQISCEDNAPAETGSLVDHSKPVWHVVFRKMKHLGFTDFKHMMKIKMLSGSLDADVMHENLCKCHLELFDTYLRKTKDRPELTSNNAVTVKEYAPDTSEKKWSLGDGVSGPLFENSEYSDPRNGTDI